MSFIKILKFILPVIIMNFSSSYSMEGKINKYRQSKEQVRKRCAVSFMENLCEVNPQIKNYRFNRRDYESMRDPLSNIHAGGSAINLGKLGITKLPKEIINLKGCINKLFLNDNPKLTLESFPNEIETLGDDFIMDIKGIPLEKLFGKSTITPKDILKERIKERNIKSGSFANLALNPESEDPNFSPGSPFEDIPKEHRKKILETMAAKSAQDMK